MKLLSDEKEKLISPVFHCWGKYPMTKVCGQKHFMLPVPPIISDSDITFGRLWAEQPWFSIPVKKTFMGLGVTSSHTKY